MPQALPRKKNTFCPAEHHNLPEDCRPNAFCNRHHIGGNVAIGMLNLYKFVPV